MLRALTLNLRSYFDWDNRKDTIISLINKLGPDFVAFQEAQTNRSFSYFPQTEPIADSCSYKYRVFAPTYQRSNQVDKDGGMTQETSYGLALLSKHPIISSETYFLSQHPDHDEACSVLFCKIEVDGKIVDICNVHFGNSDLFADLHIKELMDLCKKRNIKPIIVGDFNIFKLSAYKQSLLKGYVLSSDTAKYKSMPKSSGTLDYIVVPSSDYTIDNVVCPKEYVSDHRCLFAIISPK